jgi:dienelactone hydrolase
LIQRFAFPCLAAGLLAATLTRTAVAATAPAAPESPIHATLTTTPEAKIETSDDFMWSVPFDLANQGERGIYCDSLVCDVEDLDPGVTHASRHSRVVITAVSRLVASLSAGESTQFQIQLRATCEHARIASRLYVHDGDHNARALDTAAIEADAAPIAVAHPSQMLKTHSGQIEYLSFPAAAESLGAGAVLLIHDDGEHARTLLPLAAMLAGRGYSVGAVSLPGYGRSEGEPDFTGPRAMEALDAAFETLEHTPRVNGSRIAVWGEGSGARAAVAFAAKHPQMRAVIAQSGAYDVASAGHLKAAVLLLHGEKDTRNPAAQAHAFEAALRAHGVEVETRFVPAGGSTLQPFEARRAALDFLRRRLAP